MTWFDTIENWPFGDRTLFTAMLMAAHIVPGLPWDFIAIWTQYYPKNVISLRLLKYKIQPEATIPWRLWNEGLINFLLKKLFVFPLFVYFILYPFAVEYLQLPFHAPVPSTMVVIGQVLLNYIINDFLFYWTHRGWHSHPWLYQHVHAYHHRFTAPVSIATEFAHPLEWIFSNLIPALAGGLIFRVHVVTYAWSIGFRMLVAILGHLGFSFTKFIPFLEDSLFNSARGHDWHHSHNKGMYGELFFWDYLTGTNKLYLEYRKENPIPHT